MSNKIWMTLVYIFAVIGFICVVGFVVGIVSMGLMHGSMMDGMCNGMDVGMNTVRP